MREISVDDRIAMHNKSPTITNSNTTTASSSLSSARSKSSSTSTSATIDVKRLGRKKMSDARVMALVSFTICVLSTFIAFFSPNWLASERRLYGAKFLRLGLWTTCFRSFVDPLDYEMVKYYAGCRWIFAHEYQNIKHFLMPGNWRIQKPIPLSFHSINLALINLFYLNWMFYLIWSRSRILYCHPNILYHRFCVRFDCLHLCSSHTAMFHNRERNLSNESSFIGYVSLRYYFDPNIRLTIKL